MSRPAILPGVRSVLRAALWCVVLAAVPALAESPARSLPLTRQSVYTYFSQIDAVRSTLSPQLGPEDRQARMCHYFADVLEKGGYSFEATVANAVRVAERGRDKLRDPHFLFLAGVFQVHPDVFHKLKLITKDTRDAVVTYLGGQPAASTSTPVQ